MSYPRITVVLTLAMLLGLAVSCTCYPPGIVSDAGSLPQVSSGASPNEVLAALGPPRDKATGYWRDENVFDTFTLVWYYPGVGRVMFDNTTMRVFHTEADPSEPGHPQ